MPFLTRPPFREFLLASTLLLLPTLGIAEMTETEIRNGYRVHAAKAQFHRWYQVYERSSGGIENALDILTDDVNVKSGLGEANGHEDYATRVQGLPDTWKNAHFPSEIDVTVNDDGTMALVADVTYLNEGLLPDGAVRTADLTYTVNLAPSEGVLPKLSTVLIEQNSDGTAETFEDAYALNRSLSLVHYWLALIEDPSRNPDPVSEILADEFSLNFSSGAITDFDGFKAWLAGPGSQVAASTHKIENFSAMASGDGLFDISMEFDWNGLLPDGTELVARTRHTWTATNDVTERFARIKSVDVEVLEPFRPKEQ